MPYDKLLYAVAEGVATISLNDPDTRNALSVELLTELHDALLKARDDAEVRVVVLASTHEKIFSSGANLGAFGSDASTIDKHAGTELLPEIFKLAGKLGKPSITAASGHVLAGAVGLTLSTDLIVAADNVRFGLPEMNIGTFPFMVTALLRRELGRKRAAELLLLAEQIPAAEAERIGLINKVVPKDDLDATVAEWAAKLASKSPLLTKLGKDALYNAQDLTFESGLEFLRSQLSLALSSEDIVEGVSAFFEKREPVWKGR